MVQVNNKVFSNFKISSESAIPVYEQIKSELKLQILSGNLKPDEQLIPIREYSKLLQVNPNTIVKVYYQMDIEGFVYSKPGSGYFVRDFKRSLKVEKAELFEKFTDDYIQRILKIGYSLEDVNNYMKKYVKKLRDKKGGKK
ncbi:MAG: GntR family transcriptional regulator [Acidobacteriota bacterium]